MAYWPLAGFAALYLAASVLWHTPPLVAVVYGVLSLTCFAAYAIDKRAARSGNWRTPERTLLMLGLFCGWPGALLAQQWLRHKSSKKSFRRQFWLTVLFNVAAFVYLAAKFAPTAAPLAGLVALAKLIPAS